MPGSAQIRKTERGAISPIRSTIFGGGAWFEKTATDAPSRGPDGLEQAVRARQVDLAGGEAGALGDDRLEVADWAAASIRISPPTEKP